MTGYNGFLLKSMMIKLGFASRWVDLIMQCVCSIFYYIVINGETYRYIYPERGLCQWELLSPYLFLICANSLSALFNDAEDRHVLKGVSASKRGPRVMQHFFAGDSLIFGAVSVGEVMTSRILNVRLKI